MKKIGLALGGGGARGFAHIGILRAFENARVPVHCICGTSMGAIVGAAYAAKPDAARLEKRIKEVLDSDVFSVMKFGLFKKDAGKKPGFISKTRGIIRSSVMHIIEETKVSLLGIDKLEEAVKYIVPDIDISETQIRFSCMATDLTHGKEKLLSKGPLRPAVLASAAIPGIFPPVMIDGALCVDGGQVNNTPVNAVKEMGAEIAVACEVKSVLQPYERFEKARDVLFRSDYITGLMLHALQLKDADMVISPPIKYLHWTDFDKIDMIIAKAEREAEIRIEELKRGAGLAGLLSGIAGFFTGKRGA